MANESNTRSAGNTMEIGGGQGHNQGAGAGDRACHVVRVRRAVSDHFRAQ